MSRSCLLELLFVNTYTLSAKDIDKRWRVVDAEGQARGKGVGIGHAKTSCAVGLGLWQQG